MKYLKIFFILPLIFIAASEINRSSQLFMPEEYKTLKRIVNKISANNSNLESILFSINIGKKIEKRIEDLGICRNDSCTYFSNLNPYKSHSKINGIDLNEIINQTYIYNEPEINISNYGSIQISKSTFNYFKQKEDQFACYLAFEIVNYSNKDNDLKKNFIKAKEMIKNSGFQDFSCSELSKIKNINFDDTNELLKRKNLTDDPLENQENKIKKDNIQISNNWKWIYNRKLNTMRFNLGI